MRSQSSDLAVCWKTSTSPKPHCNCNYIVVLTNAGLNVKAGTTVYPTTNQQHYGTGRVRKYFVFIRSAILVWRGLSKKTRWFDPIMCGLTGYLSAQGSTAPPEILLSKMAAAIAHRGPNDSGTWHDLQADIGLAHRRLSILDLPTRHQLADITKASSLSGYQPSHRIRE